MALAIALMLNALGAGVRRSRRQPCGGSGLNLLGPILALCSALSWGTYLLSACLWFVYGLRKHDKTIYVACVGWILLDAAIVVGVIVRG